MSTVEHIKRTFIFTEQKITLHLKTIFDRVFFRACQIWNRARDLVKPGVLCFVSAYVVHEIFISYDHSPQYLEVV